jgi:WD40 repeat protein
MKVHHDTIAEGGASARVAVELVGSDQGWLSRCRDAARGNSSAVAELQRNDSVEALALITRGDHRVKAAGDPLLTEVTSFDWVAAAAMRDLALGVAGVLEPSAAAAPLLGHCETAGLLSAGLRTTGSREPAGQAESSPAQRIAAYLDTVDAPGRAFVTLMLAELQHKGRAKTTAHVTVPVLFGGEATEAVDADGRTAPGASGHLTLERLASGPPGLHPDPAIMGFLQTDAAMVEAIRNAWITSRLVGTDSCVVWSLRMNTDSREPADSVGGGSLGGAFAVALDELAAQTGRARRFIHRYLLDPHCAVSAEIDDTGRLHRVGGLSNKIAAANRSSLRVVVASECYLEASKAVPSGLTVSIKPAIDASTAVRVTRTHANPKFRFTVVAIVAAALVATISGASIVNARSQARVETLASRLATQAVTLSNSDPRRAALFALASAQLIPSTEASDAMFAVAQNNAYVVASRVVSPGRVKDIAVGQSTVLVSDSTASVKVLTWPELTSIGELQLDHPRAGLVARGLQDEFAVADGSELKLYAGAAGKVPVLADSVTLPFGADDQVLGLYPDSRGGVLVLSTSLKGLYWSPVTRESVTFDLHNDAWLVGHSGAIAHATAASGFGPTVGSGDRVATNAAPGDRFVLATNLGQVLALHLDLSAAGDAWRSKPVSVWLEELSGTERSVQGSTVLSLGWADSHLLVGTDAGIHAWDLDANQQTAFPYGGVNQRVDTIVGTRNFGPAAVITPSGLSIVTEKRVTDLNNRTAAAATRYPVVAAAAAGGQRWAAGRSNGVVTAISFGNRPFGEGTIPSDAAAKGIASDGTLLLSVGGTQRASSVGRFRLTGTGESTSIENYPVGDALTELPFLNGVAGSADLVVAGGLRRGIGGVVLVWTTADAPPRVLDFTTPNSTGAVADIVASVAYDEKDGIIAAYNVAQGAVAMWSTSTWHQLRVVPLHNESSAPTGGETSMMSVSRDATRLAISVSGTTTVLQTATGGVVGSFDSGDGFASISPDGTRLAVLDNDGVTFRDLDGAVRGRVPFTSRPDSTAWSPDGTILAVGSRASGQVSFIDTTTHQLRGLPWRNPSEQIPLDLVWSLDGSMLLVSDGSFATDHFIPNGIDVLRPTSTTWATQLCALAPDPLTEQEWTDVGGAGLPVPDPCSGR